MAHTVRAAAVMQKRSRLVRLSGAGLTTLLAVGLAGLTGPVPAAMAATGPTWSSSFETTDTQPLSNTRFASSTLTNVTGADGTFQSHVTAVSGSTPNPGNEGVDKIADNNSSSKWFAGVTPSAGSPLWAVYNLDSALTVNKYSLTSGNDEPSRDPKAWQVLGSSNGTDWTVVDSQSGQSFADRKVTNTYTASNPGSYLYYKLNITENNGTNSTQLSDWTLLDPAGVSVSPMSTKVSSGPAGGWTQKESAGFTGMKALAYSGRHLAAGTATSTNTLYANTNIAVGASSELSYKIYPVLGSDWDYSATYVAVDLILSDGSKLSSDADIVDQNGFGTSAQAHGTEKAFFGTQWNSVKIPLGTLAGKTVTNIVLTYDNPDGTATTTFNGYVDDIKITDATPIDGSSLTNYVDTRRGSNSNGSFSRGSNIPAVSVPNGFNFWTPFTNVDSNTLYEYARGNNASNLPTLQGVGISHETSIWMGDSDQLVFMPSTSTDASRSARAKTFSHDNEIAQPEYYKVTTTDQTTVEMTPTDHAGVVKFTFPTTQATGTVLVEKGGAASGSLAVGSDGKLTGWTQGTAKGGSGSGSTRMYVYGEFDRSPSVGTGAATNVSGAQYASFDTGSDHSVELRVATSFISAAQAQKNFNLEVSGQSFDAVRTAATDAWTARLGVIDLSASTTATDTQKASVYSSLYRMNLYPNSRTENTGTAASPVYKYASAVGGSSTETTDQNVPVMSGKTYVNNGFWDTYRTVWPLYSFLYPDVAAELVDGFVQQYRDGGWVARWSSPGYSNIMTGTSSDVAFADAYVNGVLSVSKAEDAYQAAIKDASVVSTNDSVGRKSLNTSIFLGYTPDSQGESVSWALEGYINDYGIGKMAEKLSQEQSLSAAKRERYSEDAVYYSDRANNYVKMFNPNYDFFTSRQSDGTFPQTSYNPETWWGAYTETNGWNFAFHAPYDVDGLAGLYGNTTQGLINKLDEFYATPEKSSGSIHEELEASAARLGQLGMSNQVSHHIPYISAAAGDPATTQKVVRESLQRLFVGSDIGQGYLGDEDNGEMSSWYLFSALGIYPLALASGNYTIGSPLFDTVTVHRGASAGGDLTINAANNSTKNVYVKSVKLDGTSVSTPTLSQDALRSAHTLNFEMASTPQSWGEDSTREVSAPTALVDLSKPALSTVTATSGSTANLVDDNSDNVTTFTAEASSIKVALNSSAGAQAVKTYTLTSGATGSVRPKSWTLEGSNDGSTWTTVDTRTDETFTWDKQTRAFQVTGSQKFKQFRLKITATTTGAGATIAELELLADPAADSGGTPTITAASAVTGTVGTNVSTVFADVTGLTVSGTSATIDFGDGSEPVAATLTSGDLGGVRVSGMHTFAAAGVYSVKVSVTKAGSTLTTTVPVTIKRDATVAANFDTSCIATMGTASDCDGNGNAFRKSLLETGSPAFVQGTTGNSVPGTSLKFDLPNTTAGQPDNLTGKTSRVRVYLGSGATQISLVGTANENDIDKTAKLVYADGTKQDIPVTFDNWDDSGSNLGFTTNIVVGVSAGRQNGASGTDGAVPRIWSTAPVTLLTGKGEPVWLELPAAGSGKAQYHIFAVASDGDRQPTSPALSVAASALPGAKDGLAYSTQLATVSGGDAQTGRTAMVNWGDGTAVTAATVDNGKVTGSHTYATPGTYTVTTTVDDEVSSVNVTSVVTVAARATTPVTVTASAGSISTQGSVTLAATVATDATGTVEFFDANVSVGSATVVNGKATRVVSGLVAGVHTFTAVYSGDSDYRGQASTNAATVNVIPQAAGVTAPRFSATKQVYGAAVAKRAKVAVVVTGATSGTVTFKAGSTTLGSAPVVKSGSAYTATLVLPGTFKVGSYSKVTATLVSGGKTTVSAASSQVLKVVKAAPSKVKVTAKKFKKGTKPKVTVTVGKLTNGQYASGTVAVYVGKKKVKTVKLKQSKKGKVTVTLPKRYKSSIKVKAKFAPSKAAAKGVSSKTSKTIKVRVK